MKGTVRNWTIRFTATSAIQNWVIAFVLILGVGIPVTLAYCLQDARQRLQEKDAVIETLVDMIELYAAYNQRVAEQLAPELEGRLAELVNEEVLETVRWIVGNGVQVGDGVQDESPDH